MSKHYKGRFWFGPLLSVENAERIVKVAAWVFVSIAGLSILATISPGARPLSNIIVAILFGAPAAFLFKSRAVFAAQFLFGLTLFGAGLFLVGALTMGIAVGPAALGALPILLIWFVLAWIAGRAIKATRGLRKLARKQESSEGRVAEVFD